MAAIFKIFRRVISKIRILFNRWSNGVLTGTFTKDSKSKMKRWIQNTIFKMNYEEEVPYCVCIHDDFTSKMKRWIQKPLFKIKYDEELLCDCIQYVSVNVPYTVENMDIKKAINEETKDGQTLLYKAVINANYSVTSHFLKNGADVNKKTRDGVPPLIEAVLKGSENVVEVFLVNGADINITTADGTTAFYNAVKKRNRNIIKILLRNSKEIDGKAENLTLHVAAFHAYSEVVSMLLDRGADVNATNSNNETPLHQSFCSQPGPASLQIVNDLLDKGANVHALTNMGHTPIFRAAQNGHTVAINRLLEMGADVNAITKNRETPLLEAIFRGHMGVVSNIIHRGVNVNIASVSGNTALHEAASGGYRQLVKVLLEKGADVNAVNRNNWTPLHFAVKGSFKTEIEIAYGAGKTLEAIIHTLLDHGADANAKTKKGETPLSCAVVCKKPNILKILLERGGDINECVYGHTLLKYAYQKSSPEVWTVIEEHIVKIKSAGLPVSREILERYPFSKYQYEKDCKKEINTLKTKINHHISLFDIILSRNNHQLIRYLRNDNNIQIIESKNNKKIFPIYQSMVENCLMDALARKILLDSSKKFFDCIDSLPTLPYICCENIQSCLSNKDLSSLVNIYNTQRSSWK